MLYVTRIQRERFDAKLLAEITKDPYCIDPSVLAKAKPDVRVLHPLPRGSEINPDIGFKP